MAAKTDPAKECMPGYCDGAGACIGKHHWSQGFGSGADHGQAIAVDAAGNVYVAGTYDGKHDFGGGDLPYSNGGAMFLVKFDAAGKYKWDQSFLPLSPASFPKISTAALAVDSKGAVVAVGFFEKCHVDFGGGSLFNGGDANAFIAKFDDKGAHLWSDSYGSALYQGIADVAFDNNDDLIVSGGFTSSISFGSTTLSSSDYETFVAKISSGGAPQWAKQFGGTSAVGAGHMVLDKAANIFLTGNFLGTANFGGSDLVSQGSYDAVLVGLSATGAHVWSKRFGGVDGDGGTDITFDTEGNLVLVGRFEGAIDLGGNVLTSAGLDDVFVAKLDSAGNHMWSKRFGDADNQWVNKVTVDSLGRITITGQFEGAVDFGGGPLSDGGNVGTTDVFFVRLDKNGAHDFSSSFTDATLLGLALDATDAALLTGYVTLATDFGGGVLNPGIFITKLGP